MRSRSKLRRSTEFLLSNKFIKASMILGVSFGIADVAVKPDVWNNDYSRGTEGSVSTLTRPLRVQLPIPLDVKKHYLEMREVATKELITVIEVLSPANKRSGKGRSIYEAKRSKILTSMTNLIEIDVLRLGQPMEMIGATESQYRILVSRPFDRPEADLFRFDLKDPIPHFLVPLRPESPDAIVDLQAILNEMSTIGTAKNRVLSPCD